MAAMLFGKKIDPNVACLAPLFDLFVDQESHLHWDLESGELFVNGQLISFSKYFGRSNVFGKVTDHMASNYFLIRNYLFAHPEIKRHNQLYERETPTKAANLVLAKSLGLMIPKTVIGMKIDDENSIIKPLTGGFHATAGSTSLFTAILQKRISGPNRRLFIVGKETFGFQILSNKLDYRDDPDVRIGVAEFDQTTIDKSKKLAAKLGLSYTAIDFVGNYFLEINSMPMFAAFDQIMDGKIGLAIRRSLN